MKNTKKLISVLMAVALLVGMTAALADAAVVKKVKYEGRGYVEVDFRGDVQYSDPSVVVTDASGRNYDVSIYELDEDDLTFNVANIAEGMDYSFSVNGVRSGYSGEFGSVTDSFSVPAAGELVIKEVDYDADDRELEVEFNGRVNYGELKVEVTDEAGASYEVRLREKDGDSVEVYVEGLSRGGEYTVTVSGVQLREGSGFVSIEKNFTAR